MGTLGSYLRELRTAKGMSLEEVSRATRVGRTHLEALEVEELSALPAPVFVKGFIRAYCEFLQTNPAEALSRYQALTGERTPASAPSAPPPLTAGLGRGPVFVSLILLLVLGAALFLLNSGLRREAPPARPPAESPSTPAALPAPPAPTETPRATATTSTAPSVQAEPATAAAPSTAPATVPVAAVPAPTPAPTRGPHRLVVKAIEPTWVRVQKDGERSVGELLPAGTTREWIAEKRFTLTVGNAAGVSLELNGRPLPPLGAPGSVIRELVLP